jgi:hypothetical protein
MQTGIYQHYKGGYYLVLGVAEHTETKEEVVVYVSLDAARQGPRMRVRPRRGPEGFDMAVRTVSGVKNRFNYIGDSVC